MIFINTRPASRAVLLTDFLETQSVTVLDLPLLELVAFELAEQQRQYLNRINAYHVLIFISETAVSYFFDVVKNNQIHLTPSLPIITVGQKTAQTFNDFWRKSFDETTDIITPSQFNLPENNEGLLQLPFIQNLKLGDKILILKGKDGRVLLKNNLVAQGIKVDEVDFYQRILPPNAKDIFQKFCQSDTFLDKKIALISSLTAWQHWQQLCKKFDVDIEEFSYLVLQSRILNHIYQRLPEQHLIEIDNLHPETIFSALQHFDKVAHL